MDADEPASYAEKLAYVRTHLRQTGPVTVEDVTRAAVCLAEITAGLERLEHLIECRGWRRRKARREAALLVLRAVEDLIRHVARSHLHLGPTTPSEERGPSSNGAERSTMPETLAALPVTAPSGPSSHGAEGGGGSSI